MIPARQVRSFLRLDDDTNGLPDWYENLAATLQGPFASIFVAPGNRFIRNFPVALHATEDTPTQLDLSEMRIKNFVPKKTVVTLVLEVDEGVLDATPWRKVTIEGVGTGRLELTGELRHLKRYFKKKGDITYSSDEDDFGAGAANLSLGVLSGGATALLGMSAIDVADSPDDILGTSQDDTLAGDDGVNIMLGLEGDDDLSGHAGTDNIFGDIGDDTIEGGADGDTLDGGAGNDVLMFRRSDAAVSVDLNANGAGQQSASGGHADGDVISNFEHVYGSDLDDVITGDAGRNILFGYDGDDTIMGGDGDDVIRGDDGADVMDGGNGSDWLRYVEAPSGVMIDLNADAAGFQSASGGEANGDVISNFENVQGSDYGDIVTGDSGANYILGNGGSDMIDGGDGRDIIRGGSGADFLDGGAGIDTLQYTGSAAGVFVHLDSDGDGLQIAVGGDASGDLILGFENVYATDHDDFLAGDTGRNILYGYGGSDIINGGDGHDVLRGGTGADDFIFDTALSAGNVDRIIDFETGMDQIMIDSGVFVGLADGLLNSTAFHINGTGLAEAGLHQIIFDTTTNTLYFDADGTGTAEGQAFATLTSVTSLDASDFFIF